MNEKYLISSQDFRNLTENGKVSGFQVKVRIPYYRGIMLSLIEKLEIVADGESFAGNAIRISVGDKTMTAEQALQASDVRWPFNQAATLLIAKPGGLSVGMHTIQFNINIRKSYFPKADPEKLYSFAPINGTPLISAESATKKMTLVM